MAMLVKNSQPIIPIVLLILLSGCVALPLQPKEASSTSSATPPSSIQNSLQPTLPPLPTALPDPRYHKQLDWLENKATQSILQETELSLGVGQLRPTNLSSFTPAEWNTNPLIGTGWLGKVRLPLYDRPSGEVRGWLANGWMLHQTGSSGNNWEADKRPFPVESIVYKGTVNSLIVQEIRPDGWFRLRYAAPNSKDDGTAWAHRNHLQLSDIALTVEPWEEWFSKQTMLYVRGGPYAVYKQADSESKLITQIGEPGTSFQAKLYVLKLLEFQGDWVKVRLEVPAEYCAASPEANKNSQVYEGWLQWRDRERGSRLWYYSSC